MVLLKRKKQRVNVGKVVARLLLDNGDEETITFVGRVNEERFFFKHRWATFAEDMLSWRIHKDWVETDSGIFYRREVIRSYVVEKEDLWLEL